MLAFSGWAAALTLITFITPTLSTPTPLATNLTAGLETTLNGPGDPEGLYRFESDITDAFEYIGKNFPGLRFVSARLNSTSGDITETGWDSIRVKTYRAATRTYFTVTGAFRGQEIGWTQFEHLKLKITDPEPLTIDWEDRDFKTVYQAWLRLYHQEHRAGPWRIVQLEVQDEKTKKKVMGHVQYVFLPKKWKGVPMGRKITMDATTLKIIDESWILAGEYEDDEDGGGSNGTATEGGWSNATMPASGPLPLYSTGATIETSK